MYNIHDLWQFHLIANINQIINIKDNKNKKYMQKKKTLFRFYMIENNNFYLFHNIKEKKNKKYMQNKTHSYLILNFNKGLLIKIM